MEVFRDRIGNIPPYMDICGMLPGDELEVFGQKKELKVYFPFGNTGIADSGFYAVSYTHLDVYKRQALMSGIRRCTFPSI